MQQKLLLLDGLGTNLVGRYVPALHVRCSFGALALRVIWDRYPDVSLFLSKSDRAYLFKGQGKTWGEMETIMVKGGVNGGGEGWGGIVVGGGGGWGERGEINLHKGGIGGFHPSEEESVGIFTWLSLCDSILFLLCHEIIITKLIHFNL